jgi:hypothetical protein
MPNIYDEAYKEHREILAGCFKEWKFPRTYTGNESQFPETWSVALIEIAQREIQRREDFVKERGHNPRYYDHRDAGYIPPSALVSWEHKKAVVDAVVALGDPPTYTFGGDELSFLPLPIDWQAPVSPDETVAEPDPPLYVVRVLNEKLLPALKKLREKAGNQKHAPAGAGDRVMFVQQGGKLHLGMLSATVLVETDIPCVVWRVQDDAEERYELGMVDVKSLVDLLNTYPINTTFQIERLEDALRISERQRPEANVARFKLPNQGHPTLGHLPERMAMGDGDTPLYEVTDKKDMAYLSAAAAQRAARPVLTWGYTTTIHDGLKWAVTADGYHLHGVRIADDAPSGAFIKMKKSVFNAEGTPGVYPEIGALVPRESACLFTWDFDTEMLVSVLKRARVYAEDSANNVKFVFNQDRNSVLISAKSAERGEADFLLEEQVFHWELRFAEYEFSANVNYLLQAIRPKTSYRFCYQIPPSPSMIRAIDGSHFAIVMPMSLER